MIRSMLLSFAVAFAFNSCPGTADGPGDTGSAPAGSTTGTTTGGTVDPSASRTTDTVTVADAVSPIVVSVSGIADGDTISGTVNVNVTATDNVGVTGIKAEVDRGKVELDSWTGPPALSISETLALDSSAMGSPGSTVDLRFVATDAAGNPGYLSMSVSIAR